MTQKYENLFICITLLQLKIATKIIKKKRLNKETCLCFYYSNKNTISNRYYLNIIKKKCSRIIDFRNTVAFPKYFFLLKNKFKNINIKNAYVSNIDGIYVQYVLSLLKPSKIFTFDDGAGNLYKNTNYNIGYDFGKIKSFIYRLFGNNYSVNRIINERRNHYTIFEKHYNFSSKKIVKLDLFKKKKLKKIKKNKECNVILGTVIEEYFNHIRDTQEIKIKLTKFVNSLNGQTFYIKHPRAKLIDNFNSKKIKNINPIKIAEDYMIENLFNKYNKINLYSFPVSTVQINLEKFDKINNFLILTNNLPQRGIDGMQTLKKYKKIFI